ncbi:MAG: hypothetical protein J1E42_05205 [Akkermansiaceae bacterium]|nr:hypothetical protein [Akkermansiaceae bacterium]
MKLHLPSSLRKALLACIATIAAHTLPVTVAAGSLATSGALITFLLGQQTLAAEADDEDDDDDEYGIMPMAIDTGITSFNDLENHEWGSKTAWAASDGSSDTMTLSGETAWVDITNRDQGNNKAKFAMGETITNLRINVDGQAGGGSPQVQLLGALNAANIWFTGTNGRVLISNNVTLTQATKNIYINTVQLWFADQARTGANALAANFILGGCIYTETGNLMNLNHAALRVSVDVTTSGGLTLLEDSGIALQGGRTFTVQGEVTGNGHILAVDNYNGGNLSLLGGGSLGGFSFNPATSQITNQNTSTVTLGGTFELTSGTTIRNKGSLVLNDSAILNLTGSVTVESGGALTNNGTLNINTDGKITLSGGTLTNNGTLKINTGGSFTLSDRAQLTLGGTVNMAGGNLTLGAGSQLTMSGETLQGSGSIALGEDAQLIVSGGTLSLAGALSMEAGSAIVLGSADSMLSLLGITSAVDNFKISFGFGLMADGRVEYRIFEAGQAPSWFDWERYLDLSIWDGIVFQYNDGVLSWDALRSDVTDLEWNGDDDLKWAVGSSGWTSSEGDANFINKDRVTFSGEATVTLAEDITVGQMNVSGDYTFTGNQLVSEGGINVSSGSVVFDAISVSAGSGLVIGAEDGSTRASVEVSGISGKDFNFGGITVHEGSELIISSWTNNGTDSPWGKGWGSAKFTTNNGVQGKGALVLKDLGNVSNDGSGVGVLWPFLVGGSEAANECALGALKLAGNTSLRITGGMSGGAVGGHQWLAKVKDFYVTDGSTLDIACDAFEFNTPARVSQQHTLHLGDNDDATTGVSKLKVSSNGTGFKWHLALDGDATIETAVDFIVNTSLSGSGTLTKTGNNSLTLTGDMSEFTGSLIVNAGTVVFNTTNVGDKAFSGVTVNAGGTLTLAQNLTIGTLNGNSTTANNTTTTGAINVQGTGTTVTLTADSGTYEGSIGTGISLVKEGSSTDVLTLNGTYSGGAVTVNSGTLVMAGTDNTIDGDLSINNAAFHSKRGSADGTVSITGGVTLTNGTWTVGNWVNQNAKGVHVTVAGALNGTGTSNLKLERGSLTLSQGGALSGTVLMKDQFVLKLGAAFSVGGMVTGDWNIDNNDGKTWDQQVTLADDVSSADFTINVTGSGSYTYGKINDNVGCGNLVIGSGVTLVKKGTGTQIFYNLKAESARVEAGTLEIGKGYHDNTVGYYITNLTVTGADGTHGTLAIGKDSWNTGGNMNITLANGGTVKWADTQTDQTGTFSFGALTLSHSGTAPESWASADTDGVLNFGTQVTGKNRSVTFSRLTGTGKLDIGTLSGASNDQYQCLTFTEIRNFNGYVTGGYSGNGEGADAQYSRLTIGYVHQDADYSAELALGTVYSSGFKKTGAGSLTLQNLYVHGGTGGELYMNYEGTLNITGGVTLTAGNTLVYTVADDATHTIGIDYSVLAGVLTAQGEDPDDWTKFGLDLTEVMDDLERGVYLGITGAESADLNDMLSFFDFDGLKSLDWRLEIRDGKLYITTSEVELVDIDWDPNWKTTTHPRSMQQVTRSYDGGVDEDAYKHIWELKASDAYVGQAGQVYLTGDSGGAGFIVLGGVFHKDANSLKWTQGQPTWIMVEGGTYHILVGGSSCLTSGGTEADHTASGGFIGDSHIQVEGGTVDYIVGGNHINNSSFTFRGNSYISVMDGATVNGGIVGGSTLTKGSNDSQIHAFQGDSHIFIYTALGNPKAADAMTGMWDGTKSAGDGDKTDPTYGAAFTAIVGGNAWIDRAATDSPIGMNPSFHGNSNITIDLTQIGRAVFDKDIVGGNYTATVLSSDTDVADNMRNTTFEGNSSITIKAASGNNSVVFNGVINGASRRASAGTGKTIFTGDTSISISGSGNFNAPVVGGFYFEETANGDHGASLTGDTKVEISGGSFWRVVGGSYSLAGSSGTSEIHTGLSEVIISGASFYSNADWEQGGSNLGQKDIAFIAGGSFYRNNAGVNIHYADDQGDCTRVTIRGGYFGSEGMDSIHIVGGDYANFTYGGNGDTIVPESRIEGNTNVTISNADVYGIIVAGSFVTDQGKGGKATITGTSKIDISGGTFTPEGGQDYGDFYPGHDHNGIAIVGGSMIVDEGDAIGDHTLSTANTAVTVSGGTINGHIVGGHYTTESDGKNTLTVTDETTIDLTGGSITGNIIGGHYSANTSSPDELNLGNVTITVEDAKITGNIIGGSWREATAALETTAGDKQNKGDVSISLTTGSLSGNVWAAGYHVNDAALTAHTDSTEVVIGSGFTFNGTGVQTISGGYSKGASDNSDVGEATLRFTGATYTNIGNVAFKDFSEIEVQSAQANIDLSAKGFTTEFDALTKTGVGTLTLGTLSYTGGTQNHKLGLTVNKGAVVLTRATTLGAVQIANGTTLTLVGVGGTMGDLSLSGDLKLGTGSGNTPLTLTITGELNVTTGTGGQTGGRLVVDSTGLDEETELVAFTAANVTLGSKLLVDLSAWDLGLDTEEKEYRYHLFKGLGLGGDDWTQYLEFTGLDDAVGWKIDYENGYLTLTYQQYHDKWVWEGSEEQTWSDTDSGDWTQDGKPEGKDVYFTKDGEQGQVLIDEDGVTPHAVYVEGGSYTFESDGNGGAGLTVTDGIVVGGLGHEAELELKLANTSIPKVTLEKKGTLTVSHEEALQIEDDGATEATQIIFKGGTLAYGKTTGGAYVTADLSTLVSAASTDIVRIRVGTTGLAAAALDDPAPVVWGSDTATIANNEGIRRALMDGLDKTGTDALLVEWKAQSTDKYTGGASAREGTLTFLVHTNDATTLGRNVSVAGGATVEYTAEGSGTLDIADTFSGVEVDGKTMTGRVIIGAEAADTAKYKLSGDRSSFAGTLELRGDSVDDSVDVASVAALGGEDTSLVLNGRAINLAAGGTVSAASIEVTDDTVNKLSGDAAITLTTDSLTGGGVLATDEEHGIAATDISGFTGTLVAGDADAVWTLTGTDASIGATLAGNGTITFNYSDGVVLTGAVGDATYGKGTNLENAGEGELVIRIAEESALSSGALITSATAGDIRLGDAEGTGFWAGSSISGDGAFVLTNGTLLTAITAKGTATMLNVETTKTATGGSTVDAGGTSGQLFNKITLVADSLLKGVADGITVSDTGSKLWLQFGKNNVSADGTGSHMIEFTDPASKLNITSTNSDRFVLDFSTSGLVSLLEQMVEGDGAYLHVTNGTLNLDESLWEDVMGTKGNGYMQLLSALGMEIDEVVSGKIHLIGYVNEVYLVLGEDSGKGMDHEVDGYGTLDEFKATVVAEGEELTLTLTGPVDAPDSGATEREKELGGGVINNLVGVEDSSLRLKNGDTTQGRVTVVLNNEAEYPDLQPEEARGIDTTFMGTITAEEGVDLKKAGKGTLTVGSSNGKGGLDVAEGDLTLSGGAIRVEGDRDGQHNQLGSLTFDYSEAAAADEKRGATFAYGTTEVGKINDSNGRDASIELENNGELRLTGDMTGTDALTNVTFTGDGSGTLSVGSGAEVEITSADAQPRLTDVNLHVTEGSSLSLTGSTQMAGGSISVDGEGGDSTLLLAGSASVSSGDVLVDEGGTLQMQDSAALSTDGLLTIGKGGVLQMQSADAELSVSGGAEVEGKLDIGGASADITSLFGSGTLAANGGELTLRGRDNSFSGELSGTGDLFVTRDSALTLRGVTQDTTAGDNRWDITNAGTLTIDICDSTHKAPTKLGDVTLERGSNTTICLNTDNSSTSPLAINSLSWEADANLTVKSTGYMPINGTSIMLADYGSADLNGVADDLNVTLDGMAFMHFKQKDLYVKGGRLMLGMDLVQENRFTASGVSENNPLAGADMFWNASSPNSAYWQMITSQPQMAANSDLYRMVDELYKLSKAGDDAALNKGLAAGAGASTSVLGMALAQDVRRQLSAIRNRAMLAEAEPRNWDDDSQTLYHMWLNAESSYHRLAADGYAPGYSLNSWGGTVGIDAEVEDGTTVGVALSAMYGDLKPNSADTARGDQDTTYLSAFARVSDGAWMHTLVLTGGLANVSLNRTVNCGGFSYETQGETKGYVMGALYEVGYSGLLNASGSVVVQPVFNVEYRHVALDAYSETSRGDAGLSVDSISYNVLTLGAGVRMQAAVGENMFNRSGVLEMRALVKMDAGDRTGTANNALINGDGTRRRLESATVGAVGLELGAGVSIPVGSSSGSVFFDASVELRSGYTSVDANAGYRFAF